MSQVFCVYAIRCFGFIAHRNFDILFRGDCLGLSGSRTHKLRLRLGLLFWQGLFLCLGLGGIAAKDDIIVT